MPMKTKLRLTACNISFVRIACYRSPLMCVARFTVCIVAYEQSTMVVGRFINHLSTHKFIKHIFINATSQQQIRKKVCSFCHSSAAVQSFCTLFLWAVKLLSDRHYHSKAFPPFRHSPCCKICGQNLLHLRLSVRTDDTRDDL